MTVHAAGLAGCLAEALWRAPTHPAGPAWAMAGLWPAALALRGWVLAILGRHWNVRLVRRRGQPVIPAATAGAGEGDGSSWEMSVFHDIPAYIVVWMKLSGVVRPDRRFPTPGGEGAVTAGGGGRSGILSG